jgi:Protein of unknown function (DUF2793).
MTDIIVFTDMTPRFSMPLLHEAQAHKELFVNEALSVADAIVHCCVDGERDAPPPAPEEGDTWLVGAAATGEWSGREGHLAYWHAGAWAFVMPRDGMRIFDRSSGQENLFFGFWRKASAVMEPIGGTIVDVEARTAINEMIAALRALGIFPLV